MNDSKRYHALQQARVALQEEGRKLRALEELTDEQEARLLAIPGELDTLDAQLKPYEELHARERAGSAATIAVGPNSPVTVRDRSEDDPNRGFAHLAEFALAVRAAYGGSRRVDPRLIPLYQEGDPPPKMAAPTGFHEEGHSSEGYMVPVGMRASIWEITIGEDDLLGMVGSEQTAGTSIQWAADESTPWGATGIQFKWRSEAGQMTPSKLVTDPRTLNLHEAYAFATATGEVLRDAPLLNSRLTRGAGRALQWGLSKSLMRGTGAGQPLGWLTAPCKIEVAKETSQAADTIVAKNLLKMYSRRLMMPGSRWIWLANQDIVPQLVDLKIGNEPSWQAQNQGLQQAPSGMILGIPLRFVGHCSTLGDAGDIQLVDLAGYYAITQAEGVQFASSIHLYFDYNVDAFRWIVRLGGQPFLSAAVTPENGSTTQSSIITLAERA